MSKRFNIKIERAGSDEPILAIRCSDGRSHNFQFLQRTDLKFMQDFITSIYEKKLRIGGEFRLCVVCGAECRNVNPKVKTCSSECSEMKKTGKSRDDLVREDSAIQQ